MSIAELPVKSLVKVLSELRGGTIGFDPYRDARTQKKEGLLHFILANHDNASIIAAVSKLQAEVEVADVTPNPASVPSVPSVKTIPAVLHVTDAPIVQVPKDMSLELQIAALLAQLASKAAPSVDIETVKHEVSRALKEEHDRIGQRLEGFAKGLAEGLAETVRESLALYDAKIAAIQAPTRVELKNTETQEFKDLGIQHKNFPDLLKACNAREASGHRLNIWLHGPAGTGKTHAAHEVAKALTLPFQSNGTLLTEHSLSGFIDAHGKYHTTAFRDIFENGGVYLGDEYDVWNPKAAMWLQAALSNGYTRFPDGMVKRHADCVIIFGANTTGKGATNDYSTRVKVDDANSNRVVYLSWPLDEALESAISPNAAWTSRVQQTRKRIEARKLKGHLITPRQSMQGAALLASGLSEDTVADMVLRRGLSDEHWEKIQ